MKMVSIGPVPMKFYLESLRLLQFVLLLCVSICTMCFCQFTSLGVARSDPVLTETELPVALTANDFN